MSTAATSQAPKRKRNDHTGKRFGRLTVISRFKRSVKGKRPRWLCRCDCGSEKIVSSGCLLDGRTRSCGCLQWETRSALNKSHGMSKTPTYRVWAGMLRRCRDEKDKSYPAYGGRGITVCERWHSFENFIVDMGERPPGMEIDRIENNGNYTPGNCRWTTHKENSRNTRRCRMVTHRGETLPVGAWAERIGVSTHRIIHRLNRGYPVWVALSTKPFNELSEVFEMHRKNTP